MFKVLKKDAGSRARLGLLETPHGAVETPSYVVVGTHARVRELLPDDLEKTKTQIVIANTYHLWQALGDAGLKKYPGLHQEMNWNQPLMTDSGGFQVFSLGFARELGVGKISNTECLIGKTKKNLVKVTDDGVYFQTEKGDQYLDAKKSIWIQERLGADIILAFDEPTSPLHDYKYNQTALERTHRWAKESLAAKTSSQFLYSIVQGGLFEDLRRKSAEFIGPLDFDGIAIGGSFGSAFGGQSKSFQELDWVVPHLPENKPRHLLGIGLVEDLFIGVAKGIDTFDCVVPTREGRHGNLYTAQGEINIHRGLYRDDQTVLDSGCACEVCSVKKTSRGQLHQLFKDKNPEAGYLASFHNVYFFNNLMAEIRRSIAEGKFEELKSRYV
ncbi:MAG: tRNA guanosine(34) transglycosylase Tgt [Candidatus Sungbacteria bacterium]|uniref:tRNA guanosine(34) transglycosylase Tgt n=1 Tax=Candidatus Sungiibacteriota bacterium TaxID=2750080 RepID=A0A931YD01_9BACT|nr:tRNA guanosine(34) transglycosylase Tgt [Candidatus Sungbacteria bacterium]MBI2465640.1 tRNA guanosine(34) transglycosylase Tgt [Candidatus Sungbacteria bacterium]